MILNIRMKVSNISRIKKFCQKTLSNLDTFLHEAVFITRRERRIIACYVFKVSFNLQEAKFDNSIFAIRSLK